LERLVEDRAEGEREIDGPAFVDRIAALADDWGSYFNSDGVPGSCIYPQQGGRDWSWFKAARITLKDAAAAMAARFFESQGNEWPGTTIRRLVEVKCRANGFRELYAWLNGADLLIGRADRRAPLVVLPLRLAAEVAAKAEANRG
jgi:hypothetical protein